MTRGILFLVFFAGTAGGAVTGLLWAHSPIVSSSSAVIVAICSGGLTSSVFEYVTTARAAKKKRYNIKNMTIGRYNIIKEELAYEILSASIKFGRDDLRAEFGDIKQLCDPVNFRKLFRGGRNATEGFYAFANAMSYDKYHHDRILYNLLRIVDLFEAASIHLQDEDNDFFDIAQMLRVRPGSHFDRAKRLMRMRTAAA